MNVEQMRTMIYGVYDSDSWHEKVSVMPEYQVIAMWYSFRDRGYFNKKPTPKYAYKVNGKFVCPSEQKPKKETFDQLSLFDFM